MSKEEGFDLGALDTKTACNKPFEFEVKHPISGTGLGVFISVLGKDSNAYRAKVREFAEQNLRGKAGNVSIEQLEAKNVTALVAATVGWRSTSEGDGKVKLNGEVLPFSSENARKVYSEIEPVREQAQEAVNALENFIAG